MVVMKQETDYIHAFANALSVFTIGICFFSKIPQILNIYNVKSAQGISALGLLLELTSYTITCSYNFVNRYAFLSYAEYPVLIIQEYILIYLVFYYKKLIGAPSFVAAIVYFIITGCFITAVIPKEALTFLAPFCTPVSASSKVIQLYEILRTKNSESVSVLTWCISVFSNLTRVFTIYVDSADPVLLLNFSVNLCLSSSVMIAAYLYKLERKRD